MVTKLDNMSISQAVPVTAIDTFYDVKTKQLLLLQGDENGEIVVYDISVIIDRIGGTDQMIDITDNPKRNPHREFSIEHEERKRPNKNQAAMDSDSDIDERKLPDEKDLIVSEEEVSPPLIKKLKCHEDLIKSIQYIHCTDRPMILTGSTDRYVHLIDM